MFILVLLFHFRLFVFKYIKWGAMIHSLMVVYNSLSSLTQHANFQTRYLTLNCVFYVHLVYICVH